VPVPQVKEWEEGFLSYFHTQYADFEQKMVEADYRLTDELEELLVKAADEYNEAWAELHADE
jgi:hypothetical protein